MPFKQPSIPEMPDKICIGRVSALGPSKITAGGYNLLTVSIAPMQAGQAARYSFMYRPQWFEEGFDPDALERGDLFIYSKNLSSDRTPALRAFCGSDERANERYLMLSDELINLPAPKNPEQIEQIVTNRVLDYAENHEAIFGYVMSQRKDRESGELSRFYDLNYFFPVTEAEIKRFSQKAQSDPESTVLTFEV